jgi:hypothetical protein
VKEEESTREDSTSGESDKARPGPGFVRLKDRKSQVDEDNLRNAITRLSIVVEVMNLTEMTAPQATAGGAFTKEADQYFSLPVHAEFAEADLTSFE